MFDNLKTDNAIDEQGDSLGGQVILDSGLYDLNIDLAYLDKSEGGAMALNLVLKDGNSEVKQTLWITGGDAKGNKNYYEKDGKKNYLPGFNQANALCLLTVGKELSEVAQDVEDKVIGLWDYELKKEVPTKVQMIMPLLGQDITVGLLKQTVDKTKKTDEIKDGKPVYAATGETRDENEIDKLFRQNDKMTVAEIRAQVETATFHESWATKWNGQVKMKAKGNGTGAVAGAPQGAAPAKSLFK